VPNYVLVCVDHVSNYVLVCVNHIPNYVLVCEMFLLSTEIKMQKKSILIFRGGVWRKRLGSDVPQTRYERNISPNVRSSAV
jgi:hypothetical protein